MEQNYHCSTGSSSTNRWQWRIAVFSAIHNTPCVPRSTGGEYQWDIPFLYQSGVLSLEENSHRTDMWWLYTFHIDTEKLSVYFSLPSLPGLFNTCLVVSKINIFQQYFGRTYLVKVHLLLWELTLFLLKLEATWNYPHQHQKTFRSLHYFSTRSLDTKGLRTVNLAHFMSNQFTHCLRKKKQCNVSQWPKIFKIRPGWFNFQLKVNSVGCLEFQWDWELLIHSWILGFPVQ